MLWKFSSRSHHTNLAKHIFYVIHLDWIRDFRKFTALFTGYENEESTAGEVGQFWHVRWLYWLNLHSHAFITFWIPNTELRVVFWHPKKAPNTLSYFNWNYLCKATRSFLWIVVFRNRNYKLVLKWTTGKSEYNLRVTHGEWDTQWTTYWTSIYRLSW